MSAMEINSGTTAMDGLSGSVDRADAVNVGVRIDAGRSSTNCGPQQGENARQGRHSCVHLPTSDSVCGQPQHDREMCIVGQTELGEKIPLRDWGQSGQGPEDFRAEVMARDARNRFDGDGHCGARAPGAPIADSALANTKMGGKGCNPARGLHGSVECVHTGRITYRDPSRNTFRVSVASHTVKNLGMAFSDNLRAARLKAGMTQEALALACGWSGQSRIANYESSAASARAKVSEVPLLAAALGVSIASLLGRPQRLSPRDPILQSLPKPTGSWTRRSVRLAKPSTLSPRQICSPTCTSGSCRMNDTQISATWWILLHGARSAIHKGSCKK